MKYLHPIASTRIHYYHHFNQNVNFSHKRDWQVYRTGKPTDRKSGKADKLPKETKLFEVNSLDSQI